MIGSALLVSLYKRFPEYIRYLLISSFFLLSLGDFLFFISKSLWLIFIARFLSGLGSGGQDVIQEYVFLMSQFDVRSRAVSTLGILAAASLVIGPLLTGGLSLIVNSPSRDIVNLETLPGLISSSISFTCLVILSIFSISHSKVEEEVRITTFDTSEPLRIIPSSPLLLAFILVYFIAFMGSPAFETMVIPLTLSCYNWRVFANSMFFAIAGVTSVLTLVTLEIISEFVSEVLIFVPSLAFLSLGYFVLVPIKISQSECVLPYENGCECTFADINTGDNHYIPEWRFVVGCLLIIISNNFTFTSIGKCFSKILYWMNTEDAERRITIFKNSGCVAEIIGPLWMSISLELGGNSQTFLIFVALSFFACCVSFALAPRLLKLSESVSGRNVTYSFINDRKQRTYSLFDV